VNLKGILGMEGCPQKKKKKEKKNKKPSCVASGHSLQVNAPSYHEKLDYAAVRRKLVRWYDKNQRDLPWRRTRDPYAIWISEIMLQQTRVAAVIPYWERFLLRFPDIRSLAQAAETDVLALWSGLGYYSRARNLHQAAKEMHGGEGVFPSHYDSIRSLRGVGEYTAGAVASIAFGLPYSAIDGNVRRVVMRLQSDTEVDVQSEAGHLLDRRDPGRFNQALMELGALVCLPKQPLCNRCPLEAHCLARQAGTQSEIPPPRLRPAITRVRKTLLVFRRAHAVLLSPSPRVKGFWDLPEPGTPGLVSARIGKKLGVFRHAIMNCLYQFEVREASLGGSRPGNSDGLKWWPVKKLPEIPLSTAARKALSGLA
jgi:A/G-specific adenine glycosylase